MPSDSWSPLISTLNIHFGILHWVLHSVENDVVKRGGELWIQ